MKYIITGSSGQLAKAFIEYFKKEYIDFFAPSEQDLDITDKNKILKIIQEYKPNVIINCAAYNNVELAQTDNSTAILINKIAVQYLSEISNAHNIKLVHFGTDYVFDGKKNDFYTEEDITNPLNEYGKSKLCGESEALKYKNNLVLRLSWVIGNGKQNFLYKLSNWLQKTSKLNISCDEISIPCFTFDIVKYTMLAINKNLIGLYNLTSSGKCSRYELAKEYIKLMNYQAELTPVPMASFNSKVERPLFTAMSNKKISAELQTNIPNWKDSLKVFCDKIKGNEYK
jgi:dTDP-4-dehydrorhamnose reductase